ncbi:MAG: hypothetical protein P9F19_08425 [Candidatus Contendobacter sp.]|nr:hypothetical protein [Candidatus Contendobacter sp.]MDG4557397.1 hypothetical protein [Candidatus Contendobacter sp.]
MKTPDILKILWRDLKDIFADHLDAKLRPRDRLVLAILLLFARDNPRGEFYRWNLLYRDFHTPELDQKLPNGSLIPAEAIRYIDEVLWTRRLRINNAVRAQPGNMHLLLERLCQLHANQAFWQKAYIERNRTNIFSIVTIETSFKKTAEILKAQLKRLSDGYSTISQTRRGEYGPFQLVVSGANAEVPEELSLDNVTEACPLPLQEGFTEDLEFGKRLLRVLEALNERYRGLRACGLKPVDWLARDEPSNQQMKELAELRRQAAKYEQEAGDSLRQDSTERAYRTAFEQCRQGKRKWGGFASFDAWRADPVGKAMLKDHHHSYTETASPDDESRSDRPASAESEFSEETESGKLLPELDGALRFEGADPEPGDEMNAIDDPFSTGPFLRALEKVVKSHPDDFTPVLRFFIQDIFCAFPEHQQRLNAMNDPAFRRLIAKHPAYQPLTNEELYDCLFGEVETLFMEKSPQLRSIVRQSLNLHSRIHRS